MSTHQRGVYQPLMENVPIYDLSDEELEEEEHSRLPLLIIIALLVLAAFAGVVWLAYNQGVARGRASAQVVIAAPAGPVRTAPADAGAATPGLGLKVYDQPISPEQEAQESKLAPASQEAVHSTATQALASRETAPARLNPDNAKVAAAPVKSAAPAAAPATPAAAAKPVAQTVVPATVATAAKAAAQPAAPATATPAKPVTQAAAPAPAPRASAPAVANAQTATGTGAALAGTAVLQIGAYESPEIATGAWYAFRSRFGAMAAGLAEDVQKADLGAKGTWYRLRVGPFADKAAAASACEKLRAQGGTCFVAAP